MNISIVVFYRKLRMDMEWPPCLYVLHFRDASVRLSGETACRIAYIDMVSLQCLRGRVVRLKVQIEAMNEVNKR